MTKKNEIKLFEQTQVRSLWNAEKEKWYISIINVIAGLTESKDPSAYWRKLKLRLKVEESRLTSNSCLHKKMQIICLTHALLPF